MSRRRRGFTGALTLVLVIVMLVGGLGIVTSGYKNWDAKSWFNTEENSNAVFIGESGSYAKLSSEHSISTLSANTVELSTNSYSASLGCLVGNDFVRSVSGSVSYNEAGFCLYSFVIPMGFSFLNIFSPDSITISEQYYDPFTRVLDFNIYMMPVPIEDSGIYLTLLKEPDPVKEGHIFTGWYLDSACTQFYDNRPIVSGLKIYLGWIIETYSVTFDSAGGDLCSSKVFDWNTSITTPVLFRFGYAFLGWFMPNGTKYEGQTLTSNITLIARWENVESIPLPPDPVKEGHTFTGWYYDEACTNPYQGEQIYNDFNLYAGFTVNHYDVTFDSAEGLAVSSLSVKWNTAFTAPSGSRVGYTFLGWYYADDIKYENQVIKENVTLTAKWEVITYTITFYFGNDVYDTIVVPYGSNMSKVIAERLFAYNVKSASFNNGQAVSGAFNDIIVSDNMTLDIEPKTTGQAVMSNWKMYLGISGAVILVIAILVAVMSVSKKKHRKVR